MIDHVELRTPNLDEALAFYRAVLVPLGYTQKVDGKAKGFGDAHGLDFFLIEADVADRPHYAFKAPSRAIVDACCALGSDLGALDAAPALAPHIHPNYYAGYLRDPDGRLVELTCHERE